MLEILLIAAALLVALFHMLRIRAGLGLFLLALPLLAHAGLPVSSSFPGGVAVIPLGSTSAIAHKPQAWLGEQPVLVTADHNQWVAVVGLALDMEPGSYELNARIEGEKKALRFAVNPKDYPEQHIKLKDKSKVELSPADLARAEHEIAEIKELKRHWRDAPDTSLELALPVKGKLGSRFGLRRFFNGEPRLPHAGMDLVVAQGTQVKASAPGQVLAAGDYFFNGKTIFLDHGNGIITMYCHLSRIDVKTGEAISKGQHIGLSGKSGRATGPHLHWSVILNGAMIDPELLLPGRQDRR